ncbi:MAG: GyrI-like domain-containing protein [Candidatus Thorarchaeota archaeon]
MASKNQSYEFKKIEEMRIASIRVVVKERSELEPHFNHLKSELGNRIDGHAITIFHYDTGVTDGFDAEVAYPVKETFETDSIQTRILESVEAFVHTHKGPYTELGKLILDVHRFRSSRGLATWLSPRETYLVGPFMDNPEDNMTEIQVAIHDWERRFVDSLGDILGEEGKSMVLMGHENISPYSTADERAEWLVGAVERLDELAAEPEKYEVIARCAHVHPQENINRFKKIYEETGSIDAVLEKLQDDLPFVEKPYREGSIIYTSKPPSNPEQYKKATSQEEIIKAYCFCPVVQAALEKMPKTFCYCGAGWARQFWQGVIGKPVKGVDIIETVVDGGKKCKFAVHLPSETVI